MLIELGGQDVLPMHMPGHKRDLREFPWLAAPCGAFDITEIEGFDDLNSPHGVLRDMLARISSLWGSRRSFLSVCGSTSARRGSACGKELSPLRLQRRREAETAS